MENIYYVYEHYKPNCNEPFYVGKGYGDRAHWKHDRNNWWNNIVNKYGFEVRFVAENLSEIDALWLETICIKGWGRADLDEGPLVNMTDGGEGVSGYRKTPEQIIDQIKRQTGKKHKIPRTDEFKIAQRERRLGKAWNGEHDDDFKKKLTERNKGNKHGKGHTKTKEWKDARKQEMLGDKNPMYGKKHIHNPISGEIGLISSIDTLPDGWVFGRRNRNFVQKPLDNDTSIH